MILEFENTFEAHALELEKIRYKIQKRGFGYVPEKKLNTILERLTKLCRTIIQENRNCLMFTEDLNLSIKLRKLRGEVEAEIGVCKGILDEVNFKKDYSDLLRVTNQLNAWKHCPEKGKLQSCLNYLGERNREILHPKIQELLYLNIELCNELLNRAVEAEQKTPMKKRKQLKGRERTMQLLQEIKDMSK